MAWHLSGRLAVAALSSSTIHDLSFLFYPQSFRPLNRLYLKLFARLSARRARRVITVSESTKRAAVEQYGISPEKVDVVHNGWTRHFVPCRPTGCLHLG